jgi:hypothetical protein
MKGMIEQMMEDGVVYSGEVRFEEVERVFRDVCRKADEGRRNYVKELDKKSGGSREYLADRSKELGKEVPMELALLFSPYLNPSGIISMSVVEKYSEWFDKKE